MSSFTLTVVNDSQQPGNAVLFQQIPGSSTLAWMVRPLPPGSPIEIPWTDQQPSFVWGQPGNLPVGADFRPMKTIPANPPSGSQVTFTEQGGVFMFETPTAGPQGTFIIASSGAVPPGAASVGLGLDDESLAIQAAMPNQNAEFRLSTTYGLFLSQTVQQGQVIDPQSHPERARIDFPSGGGSMKATFNADGSWTVTPG